MLFLIAACTSPTPTPASPGTPPSATPPPSDTAEVPTNPLLSVQITGDGTGRVVSSPAGIDCPTTCEASFATGTSVELTVTVDPDAWFQGFGGDCTGIDPSCALVLDADRSVTTAFSTPRIDWVQRWGAGAAEHLHHLAVRPDGSSVWTCQESGNVEAEFDVGFGPHPLAASDDLACVVSVDATGTPVWSHTWLHAIDWTEAIATHPNGDVVVSFLANEAFAPAPGEPLVPIAFTPQVVVVRYRADGTVVWARAFPSTGPAGLAVTDDHVFLLADVDAGPLWGNLPAPTGDVQIVALDATGEPVAVHGLPGIANFIVSAGEHAVFLHSAPTNPGTRIVAFDASGERWSTPIDSGAETYVYGSPTGEVALLLRGDPYLASAPFSVGSVSTVLDDSWHVAHLQADGTPSAIFALDAVFPDFIHVSGQIALGPEPGPIVIWAEGYDGGDRQVRAFATTPDGTLVWSGTYPYTASNVNAVPVVAPDGTVIVGGTTSNQEALDFGTGPVGPTRSGDPWMLRLEP